MATPYDMRVFTEAGVDVLSVPDQSERSLVGRHWNDIKGFLSTGNVTQLAPYEGSTVVGRRLQTSPDDIEHWAMRGELDFEDVYMAWW
jgi:hypothetical protein